MNLTQSFVLGYMEIFVFFMDLLVASDIKATRGDVTKNQIHWQMSWEI